MPGEDKAKKEIRKRGGAIRYRTFHPKGRPDVYMRAAIVKKKGPKGGRTVIGKVHHKEVFNLDNYLEKLFENSGS
jgi:hypothetical protein